MRLEKNENTDLELLAHIEDYSAANTMWGTHDPHALMQSWDRIVCEDAYESEFRKWEYPELEPLFTVWVSLSEERMAVWDRVATVQPVAHEGCPTPRDLKGNVWQRYSKIIFWRTDFYRGDDCDESPYWVPDNPGEQLLLSQLDFFLEEIHEWIVGGLLVNDRQHDTEEGYWADLSEVIDEASAFIAERKWA